MSRYLQCSMVLKWLCHYCKCLCNAVLSYIAVEKKGKKSLLKSTNIYIYIYIYMLYIFILYVLKLYIYIIYIIYIYNIYNNIYILIYI